MRCLPCVSSFDKTVSPLKNLEVDPTEEEMVEVPREQEYGVRNPRNLLDPKLPTKKDVDAHNLTHLPYRNWCHYCVEGTGKMAPRFKQQARTDGLTEIRFDYCFMCTEGHPLATILVAKENATKMSMATVVPLKSGSIEFPARRVLAFLKEIGLEGADVVLKSDQEPTIKDLLNNIAKRRSATSKLETVDGGHLVARSIHESSHVGSSQSNGFIERAIQDEEGQVRTIKLDFESHIGERIPSDHDLIPWLIEYVAVLLNRGQVGADGKTPYERLKGNVRTCRD